MRFWFVMLELEILVDNCDNIQIDLVSYSEFERSLLSYEFGF